MARRVLGMNQSLDGHVDHDAGGMVPDPALFRRFVEITRDRTGSLYDRRLYEIIRNWDDDQPDWTQAGHDFAAGGCARNGWCRGR